MALRKAPDNEQQLELFTAMFTDIATRDAREAMELPFLSLSKKPRFKPIMYRAGDVEITVTGGEPYGIANIWDWDLMMWLMSQVRQAIDTGERASRKIRFHRHAFLKDVRRAHGGAQYRRLEESIARLKSTTVVTTIRAKKRRTVMFSWIEFADLERDASGVMTNATVVLPEWLHEAISNPQLILSLHRDYFRLTGGHEKWLYRLVRKGAGKSRGGWKWKLTTLYERSGVSSSYKYFARDVREIVDRGRLLDYELSQHIEGGETYVFAKWVGKVPQSSAELSASVDDVGAPRANGGAPLRLRASTYEEARERAPGYDVYAIEAEWKAATTKNGLVIRDPDAAFLSWCKKLPRVAR